MIVTPRGTKDVLPEEAYKWHYLEKIIREITTQFCIREIRTPTFEFTELFLRGVGETTDVVSKEMYTFLDKSDRSMTLKPEGTAGVARAYIEHSLYSLPQPIKMYYLSPIFRFEKPQSGRLREHHQFGVEIFGSKEAFADVEVIKIAHEFFNRLGLTKLSLEINSIGCPKCRVKYNEDLKKFLQKHVGDLCASCKDRLNKNPLRILDCKEASCKKVIKAAPVILDYICDECKVHHEKVCLELDNLKIKYTINPYIVRGLDYYTKTVFEFISSDIGAQGTVCGGGRYDNLVEQIGGISTPAVGFGLGLERLIITLDALKLGIGDSYVPKLYIASLGDAAKSKAYSIANNLRKKGVSVEVDLLSRSMKAQMKYADKINAEYVIVIGDNEIANNKVDVKNMKDGKVETIKIDTIEGFFK